jgi:4-amino-4-deoxy-L-arabinose transferase
MLLVGLGLLLGFVVQGARGLYRPDEGRYTAIALRMLETGDWLQPELHHETAHYTKPPLTYWTIAASVAVFGATTFAARLPNMLAYLGTILLVWVAAKRLAPQRPWLPVALYALCAFPRIAANVVTTDTLLTLFTSMAACGFAAWRFDPARPRRLLNLMWLGLALGFLTKGPPALLPLLAVVAFTCWQDGWRELRRLGSWAGLALFLVVGLGWYAWVALTHTGLSAMFLQHEVAERILSGAHHRNSNPLYLLTVYLPVLLVGTFPWIWQSLQGVARAARQARSREAGAQRFLLCWLLLPTLVLCAAQSRLPLYLLQVFPPLVLLASVAAAPTLLRSRYSAALVAVLVGVGAAALAGARWWPSADDSRQLAESLREPMPFAPREVVFLRKPHMGLSLYLDCEVEQIALAPGAESEGHALQSLASELAEGEKRLVFCVETESAVAFERDPAAQAVQLERVGRTGAYVLYARHAEVEAARGTAAH